MTETNTLTLLRSQASTIRVFHVLFCEFHIQNYPPHPQRPRGRLRGMYNVVLWPLRIGLGAWRMPAGCENWARPKLQARCSVGGSSTVLCLHSTDQPSASPVAARASGQRATPHTHSSFV